MRSSRKQAHNPDDFRPQVDQPDVSPKDLLFNAQGTMVNMENIYQGCSAFLVGGGPSFLKVKREQLTLPGCLTMAMNNAPKSIRPDLWVCIDDPSHFLRSIWLDPKILKFTPVSHAGRPIFDGDSWKFLDRTAGQCPNTLFFRRNDHFDHTTYLHEDSINWGNHRRHGGGRSVLLAAIRLLHHLGIRQVFLLGVDMKMDPNYTYHFPQARHRASIDCNRKTYKLLQERFDLLQPLFLEAEFHVFNCNPDSELKSFPFLPFDEAVARCREGLPPDLAEERTEGLYDRKKTGRSKPPADRSVNLAPPPLLRPPRVVRSRASTTTPQQSTQTPHRRVVVGADCSTEGLLRKWFRDYRRQNSYPLTIIDYGMSEEAREWCALRARTSPLPRRFPRLPSPGFYRPASFLLANAEQIISVDPSHRVTRDLSHVFEEIGDHPLAASTSTIPAGHRKIFEAGQYFDISILGATKDDPLILEWGKLALDRHNEFEDEQEAFNYALHKSQRAKVIDISHSET